MTTADVELKGKIDVQPASPSYTGIGTYKSSGNSIIYSPTIMMTGKNRYDSESMLDDDKRISLASEELAIQLGAEKLGLDPRQLEAFKDHMERYIFQWTGTDLRVLKGRDPSRYETDPQGRKYWVRIPVVAGQEIGEVLVPEGNGRAVMEWDEVFGIPRATSDKEGDMKLENHTTHFYFTVSPKPNPKTGDYDVNVARGGRWPHVDHDRCLDVFAYCGPWRAYGDDGVRQVQGSLPEITPEFARIDPGTVEEIKARTTTIDDDAANLTAR